MPKNFILTLFATKQFSRGQKCPQAAESGRNGWQVIGPFPSNFATCGYFLPLENCLRETSIKIKFLEMTSYA